MRTETQTQRPKKIPGALQDAFEAQKLAHPKLGVALKPFDNYL